MASVMKITRAISDIVRFAKGMVISSTLGNTDVAIINIPRKCFVKHIYAEVINPYTAASTGTVTVGYEAPGVAAVPAYFMDNAAVAPLTAGMKSAMTGKYFDKGGNITVTLNKGNSAADVSLRVFAEFSPIY